MIFCVQKMDTFWHSKIRDTFDTTLMRSREQLGDEQRSLLIIRFIPSCPPYVGPQREVCASSMRHEFVHYNYTNQDQQPDSLALDFEFKSSWDTTTKMTRLVNLTPQPISAQKRHFDLVCFDSQQCCCSPQQQKQQQILSLFTSHTSELPTRDVNNTNAKAQFSQN